MPPSHCPKELVDFAHRAADEAAAVQRHHFRGPVPITLKDDASVVTPVDREAEERVRNLIDRCYPEHGVIGEELPPHNPDADYVWIVDPLDGTQLFLTGRPLFGVLLALAYHGEFILGLFDQPILGERWVGANGHGTALNKQPVTTRRCPQLADAVTCRQGIGDHSMGHDAAIDRVSQAAHWVQWGVTPYDFGLIASGFVDLIVMAGPELHDLAPLDPIIRNAGGSVADWQGRSLDIHSRHFVVAAGDPALVDQVIPLLQD